MRLNDIKIGPKLIGGFCTVALIALLVGVIGVRNIHKIEGRGVMLYENYTVVVADLQAISNSFQRTRINLLSLVTTDDTSQWQRYEDTIADQGKLITAKIDDMEKRLVTDDMKKAHEEFIASRKVYAASRTQAIELTKNGRRAEALRLVLGEGRKAALVEGDVIDKMVKLATEEANRVSDENTALANRASTLMISSIVVGVALALLLGFVLTFSITRPLEKGVAMMKELANGHLSHRLKLGRKDEIGVLGDTMDVFADDLLDNVVHTMQRISEGDVSMEVKAKDDRDEIVPALKKMITSLRGLIGEATMLSKAAVEGKLATRGDEQKFKGGYREIVKGVNGTLDAVVEPLKVAADYVDKISKGTIPPKITANYNGDFNDIKNNLNQCIDAINALIVDAHMLAEAAVEGKLDIRADAAKHQGDYRRIIEGMNNTFDALVNPLKRAIEHIEHLSDGHVDEKITREYKGDYVRLKTSFNKCFDAINLLISDTNLLVAAALDGRLETRADASNHQGDFRKIIEGVNNTLDAVVKPIQEASTVLEKMANNDLSAGMVGSYKGDLALIKDNINKVLDTLNESLAKVAEAVSQVASASQQLSSTAEEMSAGAEEQTNQTSQVATSMEEMSATVQEVAKNSNLAAQNAQGAGSTAVKGGEVVEQTVAGMQRISDSVRDLQQVIDELSKNSEKIGDIVSVIDDVADQTNLLALNAAIEAARAGEQGRGFAVVADEVRKLAERTTTSTKEIAAMVKTIQDDTSKASSSMEHSAREVENGMQHATSAGNSLHEIVSGARTVQEMVKQIATAAEQQSAAAEEISSNIESIASVSKQNAQGAQQTSSAAQELSGLTDELQSLVGRFRLKKGIVSVQPQKQAGKKPPSAGLYA